MFAVDMALMAITKENLQFNFLVLKEEQQKINMTINIERKKDSYSL